MPAILVGKYLIGRSFFSEGLIMTPGVENYGWESSENPCSNEYITPKILEILKSYNVNRVCDLGCGNGALANQLHKADFQVVGVEYDAAGVDLARTLQPEINFYNLGVQDDPQLIIKEEGAFFDAVVSTEVIEHLFSPHLLPIFARGLLLKGGYLVISTPYHGYLKNLALSIFDKWDFHHTPLWHGGHIKFWSRKTLTLLLESNGFEVIGFHGVGRFPWLWKSMILVCQRK